MTGQYGTAFVESEALLAVQEGDDATALAILADMLPGERRRLADAAERLAGLARTPTARAPRDSELVRNVVGFRAAAARYRGARLRGAPTRERLVVQRQRFPHSSWLIEAAARDSDISRLVEALQAEHYALILGLARADVRDAYRRGTHADLARQHRQRVRDLLHVADAVWR